MGKKRQKKLHKNPFPLTALQKCHRDIIQLDFQAQFSGKDGDLQV